MAYRQQITFRRAPVSVRLQSSFGRPAVEVAPVKAEPEIDSVAVQQKQLQQLQAENQLIQQLVEDLQRAVEELEQRRSQSLSELQQIAVELAVIAASHVVYAELERDGLGVEEFVSRAIAELPLNTSASIRLNPQDLNILQPRLASGSLPWNTNQINLLPDASISRGGLHLETESGRILLSDVVSRLSEVRQQWMENINDTQIERRRVQDDPQSLRRFPDRRETA